MSEAVKAKIFLNPLVSNFFDIKVPFVAFGDECEDVIKGYREGKTIAVFSNAEEAAKGAEKAALYLEGKLYKSGKPKDIWKIYTRIIDVGEENKKLLQINRPIIKIIKKNKIPFEIKELSIKDEKNKERYAFISGKKIIIDLSLGEINYPIGLMISRKATLFTESEKVMEAFSYPKNGKVSFTIDTKSLGEGIYVLTLFYVKDNKRHALEGEIEIHIRKLESPG